jgi:hypothetical protein
VEKKWAVLVLYILKKATLTITITLKQDKDVFKAIKIKTYSYKK